MSEVFWSFSALKQPDSRSTTSFSLSSSSCRLWPHQYPHPSGPHCCFLNHPPVYPPILPGKITPHHHHLSGLTETSQTIPVIAGPELCCPHPLNNTPPSPSSSSLQNPLVPSGRWWMEIPHIFRQTAWTSELFTSLLNLISSELFLIYNCFVCFIFSLVLLVALLYSVFKFL